MSPRHVAGIRHAFGLCYGPDLVLANQLNVTTEGFADSTIVDFFLQAHAALQGTAKPSHYVVILDEMKLGAEELQTITHHL